MQQQNTTTEATNMKYINMEYWNIRNCQVNENWSKFGWPYESNGTNAHNTSYKSCSRSGSLTIQDYGIIFESTMDDL